VNKDYKKLSSNYSCGLKLVNLLLWKLCNKNCVVRSFRDVNRLKRVLFYVHWCLAVISQDS